MSTAEYVEPDERTEAVENASYRWAYLLVTYALLVDVVYRSLVHQEAAWDLMALVVGGGVVCMAYQVRQKILARGWVTKAVLAASLAVAIAAILAMAS